MSCLSLSLLTFADLNLLGHSLQGRLTPTRIQGRKTKANTQPTYRSPIRPVLTPGVGGYYRLWYSPCWRRCRVATTVSRSVVPNSHLCLHGTRGPDGCSQREHPLPCRKGLTPTSWPRACLTTDDSYFFLLFHLAVFSQRMQHSVCLAHSMITRFIGGFSDRCGPFALSFFCSSTLLCPLLLEDILLAIQLWLFALVMTDVV